MRPLLLNGTHILYRNSDDFCLLEKAADAASNNDHEMATFGMKIMDASLELRKVSLTSALALQHVEVLRTQTAKYPIKRTFNISPGRKNHDERRSSIFCPMI